jgi:hypothetical protein
MGTITYPYTIVDANWFDAKTTMSNFNKVKNTLNGRLNGDNLDVTTALAVASVNVSGGFQTALMDYNGSVQVNLASGKAFRINDSTGAQLFKIEEGEVTV